MKLKEMRKEAIAVLRDKFLKMVEDNKNKRA